VIGWILRSSMAFMIGSVAGAVAGPQCALS
jgi:hypothetical protein